MNAVVPGVALDGPVDLSLPKQAVERQAHSDAYRLDIDGLRAIAVVAVILNHIDHRLLPGGYLGVDVFFVISGFVITTSLRRHQADSLGSLLRSFYARRCRRLIPALATCVLASGILAWLVDPDPLTSLKTGVAALFGVSNIAILLASQDYFAPSSQLNMFTQTWSLGVEEQFYLLFPGLVWISGFGRVSTGARRLLVLCLVFSVVSLAILFVLPGHEGGAAYYLVLGRFWELGAGCMAALLGFAHPGLAARLRRPLFASVGLALVLAALAAPVPPTVLASLLVVPPTALLILAGPHAGWSPRVLSSRGFVAVGRISYSLYLWHWPVVSASLLDFGRARQVPVQLALALALGTLSYVLVENPARRWLAARQPVCSYATAAIAAAIVAGVLVTMVQVPNTAPLAARHFREVPPAFEPFPVTGAQHVRDCAVSRPDRPLQLTTFDLCTAPPILPGAPTFWTMGDSHAGHLQGLLAVLRRQLGVGIHLVETPGIPFPLPPGTDFAEGDALFQTTLSRLKPGDVLLLGRLFLTRDEPVSIAPGLDQWIPEVERLAAQMQPLGVQVVVMGPPPMFQFSSIFSCHLAFGGGSDCDVSRASLAKVIDPIERALAEATKGHPNLHVFNSFQVLCPASTTTCSPVKSRTPQYRDRDHLNTAGAASLVPAFLQFATAAGVLPIKR